ncbi:MAG: hypothetical protein MK110_02325 [Fuerstiella sp.]|nr:hypothetical protein [Fuerstiella sp.]
MWGQLFVLNHGPEGYAEKISDRGPHNLLAAESENRECHIHRQDSDELQLANTNVLKAANVVAAIESEPDNLLIGITCRKVNACVN